MTLVAVPLLSALVAAAAAPAAPASEPSSLLHGRTLTLAECLRVAADNQPQLAQARASTRAGRARADGAIVPILPQIGASASYARETANYVSRPGAVPSLQINGLPSGVQAPTITTSAAKPSNASFDYWNVGANASLLVFDFGRAWVTWAAARDSASSLQAQEDETTDTVALNVRVAFFALRGREALVKVAKEALANQERHLTQIQGFVDVGTRPQIDLAQAKGDRANAYVQLVTAQNSRLTARAQLFQAMGVSGDDSVEIADQPLGAVDGEDAALQKLVDEALADRPDLAAVDRQIRAAELTRAATIVGYAPSLSVGASLNDAGLALDALTWNWTAQATLSWQLFSPLSTWAQQREATANVDGLRASAEVLRQQLRFEVEQAQLGVSGAKASLSAADDAVTAASERLRLAEGRYEEGQGSAIELSDAQLSFTSAEAQRVQADFNLSAARAQLLKALGR